MSDQVRNQNVGFLTSRLISFMPMPITKARSSCKSKNQIVPIDVHCLDSIATSVSISKIRSLYTVSVTAKTGLGVVENRFSHDRAHINIPDILEHQIL